MCWAWWRQRPFSAHSSSPWIAMASVSHLSDFYTFSKNDISHFVWETRKQSLPRIDVCFHQKCLYLEVGIWLSWRKYTNLRCKSCNFGDVFIQLSKNHLFCMELISQWWSACQISASTLHHWQMEDDLKNSSQNRFIYDGTFIQHYLVLAHHFTVSWPRAVHFPSSFHILHQLCTARCEIT